MKTTKTLLDHNQLIFSLAERLRDDVTDYVAAKSKAEADGTYWYLGYVLNNDKSKSKTAIKRKIVDLKYELEKLSKAL